MVRQNNEVIIMVVCLLCEEMWDLCGMFYVIKQMEFLIFNGIVYYKGLDGWLCVLWVMLEGVLDSVVVVVVVVVGWKLNKVV